VPSNIISTDNFEAPHVAGLPPVLRPLSPWNNVQQGDTRGLITIVQDTDNLFGEGAENQVVEFRKIDPTGATGDGNVTLQSTNMFPVGEGPRVVTFSMDFLELEESPFNNSQRLAIRSYYTANFGTQLDQLDFR